MYYCFCCCFSVVAGVGVVARKAEDENQEGEGDQGPPLGLGSIDLPRAKESKSTDSPRLVRSMPHKPRIPGPLLHADLPHVLANPL